jgi:toxin ParE1/3/4
VLAVEWRSTARADLLAIIDYISDDNPDAAQALKDEIESKAAMLRTHPNAFRQGRADGTRELVVRSNYVVVYLVDVQAISILRVLHAAQQWP